MRLGLIFSFCLLCWYHSSAQVKVEATPTGRHAKALNTAKEKRAEAKRQKKQIKETKKQIKEQKRARELYLTKYDSLKTYKKDSFLITQRKLPDSLRWANVSTYDSLSLDLISVEDSLAIANQVLTSTGFPEEYKELVLTPPITLKSLKDLKPNNTDSVLLQKGERLGEQVAREYVPDDINVEGGTALNPFAEQASALSTPNLKSVSKPNPNLIKPDQAKQLFSKIDADQFQHAQAGIQKLKKKYSELPDTRYPEEGTKRNSLEDLPFAKRIDISGNVGLQSTDPLILDAKIQLGYWINKKLLVGVGLTVREQFNQQDSLSALTGDGFGNSIFVRYNLPKSFFAWAEMEWQVNRSFFGQEQSTPSRWQQAHLVGVGREFKVGIVQMMSIIMYDFNYKRNDLHSSPLVFRMGVRFTKRPK